MSKNKYVHIYWLISHYQGQKTIISVPFQRDQLLKDYEKNTS